MPSLRLNLIAFGLKHWQAETGRETILDGDGRTFGAWKAEWLGVDTCTSGRV